MSVSRPYIAAALKRLSGKPFPPDTPEAMAEVINTISRLAEDEEHVARIVSKILEIPGPWPEPAVFARCADETATLAYMADPVCRKCGGCGFIGLKVSGYDYSRQCNCWARRPRSLRPWVMGDGCNA